MSNKKITPGHSAQLPQAWHATSDEIDLREWITVLWQQKALILLVSVLFSIAGVAYALLAPQVWVSQAEIKQPTLKEVDSLDLNINQLINAQIPAEAFVAFEKKVIYSDFINSFNSFNNKRLFLTEKGYLDTEAAQLGITEEKDKLQLLKKMADGISAKVLDTSNENVTLSFAAATSIEAKQRLEQYVAFIQQLESVTKGKELDIIWQSRLKTLQIQYESVKADTLKQLEDDIQRTSYSLRISQAAGIDSPVENLNVRDGFAIELGARALAEKLKVLKEIKNPDILNPTLSALRLQLSSLQAMKPEKLLFNSFSYLASPSDPLSRDKPKRLLVVVLATLLGGMLGVGIVLVRHAFRKPGPEQA
ncbi:O-antigen chain length regulator [Aeromonas taiwanensis]|uniref:O-antigen chain length regulator n=1 Tax=Aeromonas taiwanensis TaxID=633417 RepID=A0A5F0KDF9_9GAMM|nr:Wzz/FepE/Etk N-terminal domain-containing protein [Aeromonas taiwanensis]TFF78416.1 O-antigen chain length regulator [Aeromonas taiwanensis]TFF79012.1 O-antigen chain length regulator [Aeromonas taiwanensis]TFF82476.1 O-antigen chain length regulator [Aeromonas taiwanensis]